MTPIRRTILCAAAFAFAPLAVRAQDYPDRAITIVAGAAAGGPTDVISRIVAEAMARQLPQPVVVENTPPANVGAQRVAQARPDGYTLLMSNVGLAAGATLFRRLSFDTATAFAPLGLVSDAAMTITARPGFLVSPCVLEATGGDFAFDAATGRYAATGAVTLPVPDDAKDYPTK